MVVVLFFKWLFLHLNVVFVQGYTMRVFTKAVSWNSMRVVDEKQDIKLLWPWGGGSSTLSTPASGYATGCNYSCYSCCLSRTSILLFLHFIFSSDLLLFQLFFM